MGQRSDEIKKHIDAQRSELSDNLERLEERVKSTTDWRAQVERRPMTALGIAFGGGLLLGTLIPITGRRSRSSISHLTGSAATETSSYGTQAYTGSSYSGQGYTGSSEGSTTGSYLESRRPARKSATSRELRRTWDMVDTIRAAMVSFGAAKLREYLGSAIPGFEDHYRRTEEEQRKERSYSSEGGYSREGGWGQSGTTGSTGTMGSSTPGTTGTTGTT